MFLLCLCRAGLSGAGLTDFVDDVADIVAANTSAPGGKGSSLVELYGKHRLSQQYGADLATQQAKVSCPDVLQACAGFLVVCSCTCSVVCECSCYPKHYT